MSAAIRAGDGDCFVQIPEESLDADGFVIAARSGVKTDAEECASVCEDTTEGAAGVDDDKTAHADF